MQATETKSLEHIKKALSQEAKHVDKTAAFPENSFKAIGAEGLMGLLIPEAFGGQQSDSRRFVDVVLDIAGACASSGMIFVMHSTAVELIAKHLSASKRKEQILKAAAEGKHISTLACSETGTGTNFYASFSKSAKQDGNFVLNADKCFVTSARHAESYVVLTQAVDSNDPLVTSLYLVDRDAKGVEFVGNWDGMGLRGNNSSVMKLRDCLVPNEQLIGENAAGFSLAMSSILPRFLLGTASVYAGIARSALETCSEHVKSRIYAHTGESLSKLATIRRSIAEMKLSVDTCIHTLHHAAAEFDKDPSPADLVITLFEAKLLATKTAKEVCLTASQLGGGIAYSGVLPIERYLRDALAGPVMAPSSDLLLDFLGKAALGQNLF